VSNILDLIARHCPDGVEYKTLGELGSFTRGNGMQKKHLVGEGVSAIHYGQIFTHYGTSAAETKSFVDEDLAQRLRKAKTGDLVIATTSENDEDVCKAVAWLGQGEVAVSGDAYIYSHSLDPLYAAYFFQSSDFQSQKARYVSGTKVRRVSGADLARIRIPVPPLDVQRSIAEVLDKMERLEAELEAELEARTRQYEHYRNELLTSGPRMTSGRVADLASIGYGYTAKAQATGDWRFIRITDIDRNGKLSPHNAKFVAKNAGAAQYLLKAGDLLMARTGATYGKTMLVSEDMEAVFASFLIRLRCDTSRLLPAYYWHFAQSSLFWQQADALASRGGQPQFNGNALREVVIPLPPIHEQARIVDRLDGFDALVSDLSSGLPAEIAARRKQYAYYRDLLLTFPEKKAA